MLHAGFDINPKHTERWVAAIGKFMINFGGIELTSIVWIEHLATDILLRDASIEMSFSKRVGLIHSLLERRKPPTKLLKESVAAWNTAEKISRLRNEIAHSPIVFGWHGPEEQRPPDFVGSLSVKKLNGKKQTKSPLVELHMLNQGIDDAAAIAQKLHGPLTDIIASAGEPLQGGAHTGKNV